MRRLTPTTIAGLVGGLIILILVGVLTARGMKSTADKIGGDEVATAELGAGAATPVESACASQSTYDEIKRELFRQAADTRGRDGDAYQRLATYATLVVDRPHLAGRDEALGLTRCAAAISLILPPGVEIVGGRRKLSADGQYQVQQSADRSGPAVVVSSVDAIIVPLATLARTQAAPTAPVPPAAPPAAPPPVTIPEPAPQPATANPSFSCARARTRSELAICASPSLAALDREMAGYYGRALGGADPSQARLLNQTRDRFLGYRERCRDDGCIANAYRSRITEIRDIVEGRWRG